MSGDVVLYELNVRAFRDANGDGHGDLRGVIERLDYVASLGVDIIWLLPLSPSPLRDDGYDVSDFLGIHPDYGSLDDFTALLDAAHARGLRVITDLVLNHTSTDHPWFQASRRRQEGKGEWYVWTDDPTTYAGTRIIFTDTETSNWTFDEVRGQYYWHRFFAHQPDLNYDHPEVRAAMLGVVRTWLERGVDGFRLDAIPYLFEREGTNNENLPETHAFLRQLRQLVDAVKPGAFLLGEVNQWPEDTLPYFGDGGDEIPYLFHFPVMPRLYRALAEGSVAGIRWILERTPEPPAGCSWVVFLRNHDELTLEMVTEEERTLLYAAYAPEPQMRLNVGIRRRLAPLLGFDRRRLELLHSLLMTLPGAPILYYGDELGLGDDLRLPDRHGLRTPMPWSDGAQAGFSDHPAPYLAPVDHPQGGYKRVNVAAQEADPGSLLHWVRGLIRHRRAHPAIGRGSFALLDGGDDRLCLFSHHDRALGAMVAIHNLSATAVSGTITAPGPEPRRPGAWRRTFAGGSSGPDRSDDATLPVALEPHGYAWWRWEDGA
jgi:maltose alpha-D-glucosyltransferase / alpha-amylase